MKAGEGAGEAVRGFIAVLQGDIDDFRVAGGQIVSGQRQSAVADVFAQREAAEHGEALLEIKGRNMYLPGDLLNRQIVGDVLLDILYRVSHKLHPAHVHFLPASL